MVINQVADHASAVDQVFETDRETIEKLGAKVIRALAGAWENSARGLFPTGTADDFSRIIGTHPPENAREAGAVVDQVIGEVMPNLFNAFQPDIYQLMSSPLPVVSLLEMLSGSLNSQPYYAFNAAVQKTVIRWLGDLTGFHPQAAGIFTKGGTASNLYALAVARVNALGESVRKTGLYNQAPLTAYVSEEAHTSLDKAFELLGMGSDHLRKIPLTRDFRINLEDLERAISEDQHKGFRPFCVIANGGSARTGTVDPIAALSVIARKHQLWLHVDGAYGALAAMAPGARQLFTGIDQADSISMDPHKWMNVPYESSCLLVREWSQLNAAFEHVPDYLGTLQPDEKKTFSCHFDFTQSDKALKVWYALQLYGVRNYRGLFEKHLQLTKSLAGKLKRIPAIELYHEPDLSICCFRYIPEDLTAQKSKYSFYINNLNRAIELTLKEKDMLITTTTIGRQVALRVCIVSYRIQHGMIDNLIETICTKAQQLDNRMRPKPVRFPN